MIKLENGLFIEYIDLPVKSDHGDMKVPCVKIQDKKDDTGRVGIYNLYYKCESCNFEFSFYASDSEILYLESDHFVIIEKADYCTLIYPQKNNYHFLLRAPPIGFI